MFRLRAFTIAILVTLISVTGLTVSAAETNYGSRVPSSDEIINALLPQPPAREATTRGIKFKAKSEKPEKMEQQNSKAPSRNRQVPVRVTKTAVSLQIQFEFDSDQLTEQALQQLHPLGIALQSEQLSGISFGVEGHTDAIGTESYNQSLSERRASSIKRYLVVNYQIAMARLQTIGLGESELLLPNRPSDPANRRVRIVTLNQIASR